MRLRQTSGSWRPICGATRITRRCSWRCRERSSPAPSTATASVARCATATCASPPPATTGRSTTSTAASTLHACRATVTSRTPTIARCVPSTRSVPGGCPRVPARPRNGTCSPRSTTPIPSAPTVPRCWSSIPVIRCGPRRSIPAAWTSTASPAPCSATRRWGRSSWSAPSPATPWPSPSPRSNSTATTPTAWTAWSAG